MDQNDQRDLLEEATNRQIDRDEVEDFAGFEYEVGPVDLIGYTEGLKPVEQITQRDMENLLNSRDMVHFVDGDDDVAIVTDGRTITVLLQGNQGYAINIDYIRYLISQIDKI